MTNVEVARGLAKRGQQHRAAAGYDLVYTPSKSVSVLWGLGDPGTRETITRAHTDAWRTRLRGCGRALPGRICGSLCYQAAWCLVGR